MISGSKIADLWLGSSWSSTAGIIVCHRGTLGTVGTRRKDRPLEDAPYLFNLIFFLFFCPNCPNCPKSIEPKGSGRYGPGTIGPVSRDHYSIPGITTPQRMAVHLLWSPANRALPPARAFGRRRRMRLCEPAAQRDPA